jgi:4-hydroxybenzoate polyprenyltransferase
VVNLDRTLIRSDLPIEMIFGLFGRSPRAALGVLRALASGRAAFQRALAETAAVDVTALPYDEAVIARIETARAQGQPVYLVSESDEKLVGAVAAHLGLFEGWFASDGSTHLAGEIRAAHLAQTFGEGEFDYLGSRAADQPVWERAGKAIAAGTPRGLERALAGMANSERIDSERAEGGWPRLLRPDQWAKNALVFVPILTAHQFTASALALELLAAVAFSACASSVYILNDLVDIEADRAHPRKRERPFASGAVSFATGASIGVACFALAFAIAASISWSFAAALATYFTVSTAYSLFLKRKMIIDALTLAGLYTVRVIGGAVAIAVPMSEWLLAFSMFIFLSLALVKRYSELVLRFDAGLPNPANRDYRVDDLSVIASLAAAAGYSAVIVLALYVSSDAVRTLYSRPAVLWLACPVLLYWVSRTLMLSHRRVLHDDPVIFALKDRVSLASAAIIVVLGLLAL